jgi:hypothetical protein
MAKKRHSPQIDRHSTLRLASVPKRQPASTRAYLACRSLESAKAVIEFLGLSYSEVGKEYGRITGGAPISKQAIYKKVSSKFLDDGMLLTLGQLLSNRLTLKCGTEVAIDIAQNSPLVVTPLIHCSTCGDWYRIDRPGVRNCPRCR